MDKEARKFDSGVTQGPGNKTVKARSYDMNHTVWTGLIAVLSHKPVNHKPFHI